MELCYSLNELIHLMINEINTYKQSKSSQFAETTLNKIRQFFKKAYSSINRSLPNYKVLFGFALIDDILISSLNDSNKLDEIYNVLVKLN